MSYRDLIKKELENKGLKPASIKLYSIKLNKLYNELKGTNNTNDHLNNKRLVMNYINKLNSTDDKLAYLNSIIKFVNNNDYIEERNKLNKIKIDKYKNNIQSDDFINYKELLNISPKPDFTKDPQTVLNDMLLYISIRYPMRLALQSIKIVRNKKQIVANQNYLYITSKAMKFVMQDFKNVNSLGKQEIDIDTDDKQVIKDYLKYLSKYLPNVEYLLYNYYNGILPFSSSDIYSRNLKRLLQQKLNKDLTMNDIRKAYESDLIQSDRYRKMTNKEKDKAHLRLLHTTEIAQSVYNKINSTNSTNSTSIALERGSLALERGNSKKKCDCCDLC